MFCDSKWVFPKMDFTEFHEETARFFEFMLLLIIVFITIRDLCIYIYIYCHLQTDCFVLSELFSVARLAGRSKPGSKPIQLYVRLSLRPLGQQAYHVLRYLCSNSSSVRLFPFLIPYRLPECSILSKSFALCKRRPTIPSPECSCTFCFIQSQKNYQIRDVN